MATTNIPDAERRRVAARLRKAIGLHEFAEVLGFSWTDESDWVWNDVSNLVADLIEPSCDLGTSGWVSFDERLPEPGVPVLCKGENGTYYVGKPVTYDGERTGEVWVPRGAEYRLPAAWKPVN